MDFYDSLTYLWNFERFYGLNYLTNIENELKITTFSLIRALIPGTCYVLLTFLGMNIVRFEESDIKLYGIGSIIYIVGQIGIVCQYTNCAIIFIMSFIHRKRVIKLYEKIFALDQILITKLEIYLDYRKMKFYTIRRMFGTHFGLCCMSAVIDWAYAANYSYILLLIIYNYTAGAGLMTSLEFNNCTRIVKFRFKLLNNLLIKNFKFIKPNDLEIMIKCHFILNELINDINEIYGLKQLSTITNDFAVILVNMYAFLVSIENNFGEFGYVKFLFGSLMLPSLMTKLYFTVTNCQEAVNNKKYFGQLLKKLTYLPTTDEGVSNLVYRTDKQTIIENFNASFFIYRLIIFCYMIYTPIINLQHILFST